MAQTYNDAVPASTRDALEDLTAIRNNFAALKSCFSGATAPPNPVAGMWWYDTTANMLKIRNEANDAWLNVYDFANGRAPLALLATNCSRTVVAGTGVSVSGSLASSNVTVGLSSGGVDATQLANGAVTAAKLAGYTAGNILLIGIDTEETSLSLSPYKVREIQLDKGGTLRIKFEIKNPPDGGTSYGRIYRNGTAVGTLRTVSSYTWNTFTQDISGWSPGDTVQLYVYGSKVSDYYSVAYRNFRIGTSNTWPVLGGSLTTI